MRKIAVLTGGGDCPGLNAVIRAVAKTAWTMGWEVVGFLDGYSGLVENRYRYLDREAVSGLLHRGGTILGTNNRDNPFHFPVNMAGTLVYRDCSGQAIENLNNLGIEALIAIGGDGSLSIARDFKAKGLRVVGVPKTIDNDLAATEQTFGFATAVTTATEALDKLHTTAESHHRVMVLEVMGRYAGWIALHSGLAGGADVILIPEINWRWEAVAAKVRQRVEQGKSFSIVVVAEGAKLPEGGLVVRERIAGSADPLRLGGIGQAVADGIARLTELETRVTVLGHIQRGGSPIASDRILATRFGVAAVETAAAGQFGTVVCLQGGQIVPAPLEEATKATRTVPPDYSLIRVARATGVAFGE